MEAAYVSALAALAGSAIGGLTSFATSWATLRAQTRAQRRASEADKREALFGRFLDEAAKLYADALQHNRDEASELIGIYVMIASARVVETADTVARTIMEAYSAPNMTLDEIRAAAIDPLQQFSEAARQELRTFEQGARTNGRPILGA
jgi:hypothetical protein